MQHPSIPSPYPMMQQPQYPGVQYQQFVPGFFPPSYIPYSQNPGGVQPFVDSRASSSIQGLYTSEPTLVSTSAPSVQEKGYRNEVSGHYFSHILVLKGRLLFWVSYFSKQDFGLRLGRYDLYKMCVVNMLLFLNTSIGFYAEKETNNVFWIVIFFCGPCTKMYFLPLLNLFLYIHN